jgi:hypothetical protein
MVGYSSCEVSIERVQVDARRKAHPVPGAERGIDCALTLRDTSTKDRDARH